MLLSPSRNPVRTQCLEAQIAYHKLPLKRRQLQNRIRQEDSTAGLYRQAFTKKDFSADNVTNRLKHGQKYAGKTIEDTFQFWVFTDETHFDPTAQKSGQVLRRRGNKEKGIGGRLAPENMQKKGVKAGVKLHAAGWCNWWDMAPKLIWYHEQEDYIEQPKPPKRPTKPRKSKYETQEDWETRVAKWEADFPQPVKVQPLGNSMTGKTYYTEILPHYITAIQNLRLRFDIKGWEHHFVLQEDNDRSHGHTRFDRPNTIQDRIKRDANIKTIEHPPISPDVNPQEAVWNILKEKVKARIWTTLAEYKQVIEEEYSLITLDQIRRRILEIPERMQKLVDNPEAPIRSELW